MERLELPAQLLGAHITAGGRDLRSMSRLELEQYQAELGNRSRGSLEGYDCPDCLNRGYFHRVDQNGCRYVEECRCMAVRRGMERIRRSGLADILERCTLDTWQTREGWQRQAKGLVEGYAAQPAGWFFAAGPPGTGKTHLCTALCGLLMEGGLDVRYMLWRDVSVRAKALVNEEQAYQQLIAPLKGVSCLYIDDLFKTGKGQSPTTGDVNLAFELLNARYNDQAKLTILSSEYDIEGLLEIDEAVGSRIYERCRSYYLPLTGKRNWRLCHETHM